ncbi:MAG: sugar ABC transporter substrate-binding protein [Actinobacteria bacterium]|nr:sugar ABC transporter substrate-binding protein [Actinomycetota bacterium]
MNSLRIFKLLAVGLTLITAFTIGFSGCKPAPVEETAATETEAAATEAETAAETEAAAEKVKLVFAGHGVWIPVYQQVYELFQKTHPNIEIEFQDIPEAQRYDNIIAELMAGKGAPDMTSIEIGQLSRFMKGETGLVDLTDYVMQDKVYDMLAENAWAIGKKGDRIYGIPAENPTVILYYREDLFQQAGIDATKIVTWDDYVEAGKKISKNGKYMLPVYADYPWMIEQLLIQRGLGGFFDKDGNVVFDSPKAIEVWTFVRDLVNKDKIGFLTNGFQAPFMTAIGDGTVATLLVGDWWLYEVPKLSPEGKWKVMLIPSWKDEGVHWTAFGGTMYVMLNQTKHPKEAWEFLKFLGTSKEGGTKWAEFNKGLPALKIEDPNIFSAEELKPWLVPAEQYGGQVVLEVVVEARKQQQPHYLGEWYGEAQDMLKEQVISNGAWLKTTGTDDMQKLITGVADQLRDKIATFYGTKK